MSTTPSDEALPEGGEFGRADMIFDSSLNPLLDDIAEHHENLVSWLMEMADSPELRGLVWVALVTGHQIGLDNAAAAIGAQNPQLDGLEFKVKSPFFTFHSTKDRVEAGYGPGTTEDDHRRLLRTQHECRHWMPGIKVPAPHACMCPRDADHDAPTEGNPS